MDFDSWDYEDIPSTSSINLKFIKTDRGNPDLRMDIDDYDGGDESIYPCPYCSEDYADAVSVECHIREAHPTEAEAEAEADLDSESCPVCSARIGNDIVDHLILNHTGRFTIEQLLKIKKADSFGKEFRYCSSRTNLVDSILGNTSSNGVVDNLMLFICEMPPTIEIHNEQQLSISSDPCIDAEELSGLNRAAGSSAVVSEEKALEDMEARSRCDFAQDLMFSALFDDVDL